jgi:signal transduction histidine kinase
MASSISDFINQFQSFFYLIFGLLFYTIGLSVLLHSRHYSRLTLAKSLPWFGAFGITIAAFEWGYIYIPLLIKISGQQYATILLLLHQILLATAFIFLFQFGVEMLGPYQDRRRWMRLTPTFFFAVWLVGPYVIGFSLIDDIYEWGWFANACSRYLICFPASFVTVVGLIRQQRRQIKPLKLPRIDSVVRFAAGALAAYGVFAGLVVPKTFFFPATIINTQSFTKVMFFSPYVYLSIIGIILLITVSRILEIFDFETDTMIKNMEEAQVIANERESVARDLHDGVLQQVYASGLLAQSLLKHVPQENRTEVDQLISTINQAIDQLRGFLPQQKADYSSVDLVSALLPKIEEARQYVQIETDWNPQLLPSLSVEQTRHISAFLSEALSNAIRHSRTERIKISISCMDQKLKLQVQDYGTGISPSAEQGHGLKNMRDRARLLGADFSIESEQFDGTVIRMELFVTEESDGH